MVDVIRKLCRQKKISLAKLERSCDIGSNTIHRWDDVSPSIDKVVRVANFFSVSVDYLLSRDAEEALSPEETELILLYRQLNDDGKAMAREYIEYISSKDKYKKCNFASELEA